MLRVLDSYAEILRTFSGQPFSLGAWQPYAEKISAALPRKCLADTEKYDFLRQVKAFSPLWKLYPNAFAHALP